MTYSAAEHVALFSIVSEVNDAFNTRDPSVAGSVSMTGRVSSSAFGTWLSRKCPTVYEKGDDSAKQFINALNNLLVLDAKKCMSKKWWSRDVVEMLLPMHLANTSEFNGGQKKAGWLSEKATAHKSKFETDQKNRLDDAAKHRQAPPANPINVLDFVEEKMVVLKLRLCRRLA
jgi:hypothetical protein